MRKMICFVMHGIGKVGMTEKLVPGPNDAVVRSAAAAATFARQTRTPWQMPLVIARG